MKPLRPRKPDSCRPIRRPAYRPALEALDPRLLLSALPRPEHVVVVVEENHSYGAIIGSSAAPYINSLAGQGASFTQSFASRHPSQPNYLDLFSGSNQGITNNTPPTQPFTTPNLGAGLIQAGLSFGGYSEGLPSVGSTVSKSGDYARKHNPWSDWQGASANAIPAADNMPFTSFPTDFTKLPTVSFVVPNQQNDMHDGSIRTADTWLQTNLDSYVQWAKTHNSLLIVTWDEDDHSQSNQVPTIFVGPMVQPGQYSERINHFNVLRSIEDMYNLPYSGASATATPITDVWAQSSSLEPGDAGFERPNAGPAGAYGSFLYDAIGSAWTFAGAAGVAANDSGFTAGNPPAPEGAQVAFLEATGSFSQSIDGWQDGSYRLSFQAAQRGTYQLGGPYDFDVLVDDVVVATIRPADTTYRLYTTGSFQVAAGTHTIAFRGRNSAGGDNTSFLDDVRIHPA
jgi:phosphatidylinositol-3-phosphatase